LQELGHYAVAKLFYFDVTLYKASVDAQNYKFNVNKELGSFLKSLAGPISTILVSFIGIVPIN
jgi:Zn-dependent protease|tara:strand:- start:3306 stop:3494 length:189 start_codon:yes stop_codon:yes gene_type:complete